MVVQHRDGSATVAVDKDVFVMTATLAGDTMAVQLGNGASKLEGDFLGGKFEVKEGALGASSR